MQNCSSGKRASFRSKTKLASTGLETPRSKQIESFESYLHNFPADVPEDVMGLVRGFEPTHNEFLDNLQNLKLYKQQLGCYFESNWIEFQSFLRGVVLRLSRRTDRLLELKEAKIIELMQMNKELESQQHAWKEEINKLQATSQLEKAQLAVAESQLETVNAEMCEVYKVLQTDMGKIISYLGAMEGEKAKKSQESAAEMFQSVSNLSLVLAGIDQEHRSTDRTLETMRELIKAMTRCTKASTSTQVDESQLQTKAGSIFSEAVGEKPFEVTDGASVNTARHVIDSLKEREKQVGPEGFRAEKHAEKPWALTPTVLAFLENMSRQNEAGKVLPWQHMKTVIAQIYEARLQNEQEIFSGGVGNAMQFDEFVVFHFVNRYRTRRLAEVKLLQFVISLKYYCKFWIRAETFCQLMDIMRYHPLFDTADGFNYRFDYDVQNFFFSIYRQLVKLDQPNQQGVIYVSIAKVKKIMKAALSFTDELSCSRLCAKLEKDQRIFENVESCDFDSALQLFMDEYFTVKKRNNTALNKAFSRAYEITQGYFSLDDMSDLLTGVGSFPQSETSTQRYPLDSKLQVAKLYLYALTSGKNNYEMNSAHFLSSCQRFGFDAPYPFLHICGKTKKLREEPVSNESVAHPAKIQKQSPSQVLPPIEIPPRVGVELSGQRIDVGAKLFAQHFGVLRQLQSYVDIFAKSVKDQKDPETLWKSFGQISAVLQRGCYFMKLPLHVKG